MHRILWMASLIIAGEAIFTLPYHVARFFRPTMLRVFDFTNTELGGVQAVYGVVAMVAYLPGGALADWFSARKLMAASLVTTGAGGLYFATVPGRTGMALLFGFWGASSILLFWAALIRGTREWGGQSEQGRAFGILDGGRGLVAALMASGAVLLFKLSLPADPKLITDAQRVDAVRNIILIYTAVTLLAAMLVWFFVPESTSESLEADKGPEGAWSRVVGVVQRPTIWCQATIVVCAYVAYKGFDQYSLYAVKAYGMSETDAAGVTALGAWVRPFAAVGAGVLGDRVRSSRVVAVCFVMLIGVYGFASVHTASAGLVWLLFANVVITCIAFYGLRGVYFALFEEAKVPAAFTGTAVGLVSVIGYTPDVFVAPITGWLLDRSPGLPGFQHLFVFLGAFAVVGLVATLLFQRVTPRSGEHEAR